MSETRRVIRPEVVITASDDNAISESGSEEDSEDRGGCRPQRVRRAPNWVHDYEM